MSNPPDAAACPVLILHNRYRQPGGEDVVVRQQAALLRARGHAVRVHEKDNREIDGYGLARKAGLFFKTAGNPDAAQEVERLIQEFKPRAALVHNTLPLLSPAIYRPLKDAGVKVIQYLHNYRLVCAAGTLFRDGQPCSLCVDDGLKHAVHYRCWNNSKPASLAFTRMLERHRRARTWFKDVDLFVALNTHQRDVLVLAGAIPADKVAVQPNFSTEPPAPAGALGEGFVFLGRLAPEKGVETLLQAHALEPRTPLKIIGGGPLLPAVRAAQREGLAACGPLEHDAALRELAAARALIFPSLWQETFGLSLIEAMALGRPVIASRVAGPREIVQDGVTGLLFDPGDAAGLAACIRRLRDDAALAARLGQAGRERYEKEYSPDAGYRHMSGNFARLGV